MTEMACHGDVVTTLRPVIDGFGRVHAHVAAEAVAEAPRVAEGLWRRARG